MLFILQNKCSLTLKIHKYCVRFISNVSPRTPNIDAELPLLNCEPTGRYSERCGDQKRNVNEIWRLGVMTGEITASDAKWLHYYQL